MDFLDVKGKKVKSPKEYTWRPAVYGVLICDNKLLIIQPDWDNSYSLPGGSMELGENPLEALEREFLEETGYKVKANSNPIFVDSKLFGDTKENKYFQRISMYYEVKLISTKQKSNIDKESIKVIWKDMNNLKSSDFTFFQRDFLQTIFKR
jgi:8-oxo-dGTP diphosphatase